MGLHLSFGLGPIRYTTSSRRRYKTKAQREADSAANAAAIKAIFWLTVGVLVVTAYAVWSLLVIST